MFVRYSLRTLDVEAARAFYGAVLGLDFSVPVETSGLEIWPLHEQARARGAPPHWLGQLATADFEGAVARFVELGGERLGPLVKGREGISYQTLRDPTGAVLAIRESTPRPERASVAWHHLHTRELEPAWSLYSELFGWRQTETFEALGVEGGFRVFTWDRNGQSVGSVANSARGAGVHTHWLYFFPVTDLERSLSLVREKGGKTLPAVDLPNGARLAGCDDPQGAAFGLFAGVPTS
jgi:predicted enzyme related to lactoylglutathione lyase